ncbi:hypothetical protein BpHYR1_031173 [Brachionus plicatilis]|uniref:Uncharacterized protein n=1 Tax=Brachionus plicatilis TaxID=10195 RepID=A0A3M7QH97_BRAPC|nr:hypothetical protein BpHYR1_031173 [Brachionus plicatilis]
MYCILYSEGALARCTRNQQIKILNKRFFGLTKIKILITWRSSVRYIEKKSFKSSFRPEKSFILMIFIKIIFSKFELFKESELSSTNSADL